MNALLQNGYTDRWAGIGSALPLPKAILCVSAHWYVPEAAVTVNTAPRTIHDFGGFPRELYEVKYPAPGDPDLARRVQQLLAPLPVELDEGWGLDHGTWSVLCHAYPKADIPVVQLSIDETTPAPFHYQIGQALARLREEGALIVGSGNLVHNLHTYAWAQPVDPLHGRFALNRRPAACSFRATTGRSSITRPSEGTQACRSQLQTTTCRCSMSSVREQPESR